MKWIKSLLRKKIFNASLTLREFGGIFLIYLLLLIWFLGKSFMTEYLAGDWIRFWVPNYQFTLSYLKEGLLPLWQPYVYMGVPAALHPGYMIAYPPLWIVFLINLVLNPHLSMNILGKTLELYLYSHLLLGGLSMYVLLRDKIRLSTIASFSGGFIYMFSIFTVSSFDPTLIGKMYLPLIIYLLLNVLQKGTRINFLLWIATNWILFGLGYPYYQIYFVYAQLILSCFFGFRAVLRTLFGFGITFLLSAFILLPQAYYYLQAGRIEEATKEIFHLTFSPLPTYLVNILMPSGIYVGNTLSWGTIPLIFLIIGFVNLKKEKFTFFLITLFVLSLILGLGGYLGVQNLLGIPPFFLDKLRSHGQLFVLTFFSGAMIIASGIDASLHGKKNPTVAKALWGFCIFFISLLLLVPFLQNNYLIEMRETLIVEGRFLVLFVCGLLIYHFITHFKHKVFIILLLFLTFLEFHYYYYHVEANKLGMGKTYNEYFAQNRLIPELPTKDNLFRHEFWGNQFMYNGAHLRVFTLTGYDGIPYEGANDIFRLSAPKDRQFANIKYIVTTQEQNIPEYILLYTVPPPHRDETIFSTEKGYNLFTSASQNVQYIYQVKDFLPRFFVPQEVMSCPYMGTEETCYKKENPPVISYTKEPGIAIKNPDKKDVTINVVSYTPNKIILEIVSPKKTFISSSEIWDKGWKVTVNGQPAVLYNVSNGFRGVIVPTGKSTIIMSYVPPYFIKGLLISLGGIILLMILSVKYKKTLYNNILT